MTMPVDVNELIRILEHSSLLEREYIITRLPQPVDELVEPLIVILQQENGRLSWLAAGALSCIEDVRVVPALLDALSNVSDAVQTMIIELIGDLGDQRAVNTLIEKLSSESSLVQMAAIQALLKIGDKCSVIPLMRALEQTKSSSIRYTIIEALGDLEATQAVELIQRYASDENHHVRRRVDRALAKLNTSNRERQYHDSER